ncbi:hypothetical protein GbCGDNIH6_8200 [Granulibacter bethesdensis]|nr:hypothetical protein GbCGDNIH6_8200 [Granulibacter bethesdensis]
MGIKSEKARCRAGWRAFPTGSTTHPHRPCISQMHQPHAFSRLPSTIAK